MVTTTYVQGSSVCLWPWCQMALEVFSRERPPCGAIDVFDVHQFTTIDAPTLIHLEGMLCALDNSVGA